MSGDENYIYLPILSLAHSFGKRVKALRVERGITRESLAEAMGVEPSTIKAIELGNRTAFRNIELLALVLRVEPRDLFDFGPFANHSDIERKIVALIRRGMAERADFGKRALAVLRALLDK